MGYSLNPGPVDLPPVHKKKQIIDTVYCITSDIKSVQNLRLVQAKQNKNSVQHVERYINTLHPASSITGWKGPLTLALHILVNLHDC